MLGAIGLILKINHSTVAKSGKRLEESGLVVRMRSEVDKRITNICLTEDGNNLKDKVFQVLLNVDRKMSTNLSTEEQQLLISLINNII